MWQYWENERSDNSSTSWVFNQILGLAGALAAMHAVNCRHGDLKPENILRFNAANDAILVIGDVGISRFHKQETFQRKDQTTTSATTPSYQAPEVHFHPRAKRSRVYDIWSLGCIFLEFAIWHLWDFDAVMAFQSARQFDTYNHYFYKPMDDGRIIIHPMVTEAISSLQKDPRCDSGTPFGSLITLIADDLLQLKDTQRAPANKVVTKLQDIVSRLEGDQYATKGRAYIPRPPIFQRESKQPSNYGPKDSGIGTDSMGRY